MRPLFSFIKKEWTEQIRSSRLLILAIIFVMLGVMNPATAKLTPWLLETMADSLEQSGMQITEVTVSALDSWMQFFKNIPMGLVAFILIESTIFTKEYHSGTLVPILTKGLDRYAVVISKASLLSILWTAFYWLNFGITYAYSAYFWDNSAAQNLTFSALCWYVFGIWVIALTIFFSTLGNSNIVVLCATGGTVLICSLLSFFPKIAKYLPSFLSDGNSLIYGIEDAETYTAALIITVVVSLILFALSIPIFNKKQL